MSRRMLARAALALVVLGTCVAGFFTCFEKREIEVATGVSKEARRNRYLALGRLLERMGHTVVIEDSPARLSTLPDPPATLILPTHRLSIGARRSQALIDWVARGGHLVVVGSSLAVAPGEDGNAPPHPTIRRSAQPDLILERFGLRRVVTPLPREDGEPQHEERPPEFETPTVEDILAGRFPERAAEACRADFPGLSMPLEVGFGSGYQWLDPNDAAVWRVAGPSGVHLVELRHERGRISALTSDEPLANPSIGERDNAEFVVRWLRRDAAATGPIWIFYDEEWPSLFALVKRHALPAVIAVPVLLFTWVWSVIVRFGGVFPETGPARRAWLEHLDAAGRFHWREDRGRALLDGMRQEVVRRTYERHPGWRQLARRERVERIAERARLAPAEVWQALEGPVGSARSFGSAVSALERIRGAL